MPVCKNLDTPPRYAIKYCAERLVRESGALELENSELEE
jgi:hypothetical protein